MSDAIPLGLYLHFPWCVSKCPYCDFNSHALRDGVAGRDAVPEAAYIESLQRDLEHQLETQAALIGARRIATVFMGGGTPSLFSPAAIGRLLEFVQRSIGLEPMAEITLEANPGTIERGRFAEYASAGVNRVSLGAQSFDAAALHALGRIHTPADTQLAAQELHAAGLANFNLDLMYGLPAQDRARALQDVAMALALEPAQISHYHLTLEPGTPFAARPPAQLPDDEATEEMLAATTAALAAAGYARYEVSAYARAGRRCAHNLLYWQFGDYLGIGAGAHGKLSGLDATGGFAILRSTQPREPRRYQRDPRGALLWRPVVPTERPFEFMLNALRLLEGFDQGLFEARTGLPWSTVEPTLRRLVERGLLTLTGAAAQQVTPTATGLRWLNELLLEFLSDDADTRSARPR